MLNDLIFRNIVLCEHEIRKESFYMENKNSNDPNSLGTELDNLLDNCLKDLWTKEELRTTTSSLKLTIPSHGTRLIQYIF